MSARGMREAQGSDVEITGRLSASRQRVVFAVRVGGTNQVRFCIHEGAHMSAGNKRSGKERRGGLGRRSGRERRSGFDTRTDDEKKRLGERRSDDDRRSGVNRRERIPRRTDR